MPDNILLVKYGSTTNTPICQFIVNSVDDLDTIEDKHFGDVAFCIEDRNLYIRDADMNWVTDGGGGGGGTTNYNALSNKPSIEGHVLTGSKDASDYGLATEEYVDNATASKQDVLSAGFGIDITDGVISVDIEPAEGGEF